MPDKKMLEGGEEKRLLKNVVDETNKAMRRAWGKSDCCILASYAIQLVLRELGFEKCEFAPSHL